ncbi:MAG: BatA and WFA domain-containing protein [Candidatus Edwardsbacteria bacterium]|nr:BatA and WFA domain-containing protein [Candidatus Edwardsbacteria bacterium]MBU1577022.1 BatA and WFA domain-containing protein [Candidatus Edwardsbacteria bacterium]MBU2464560.1 BatA and WFA domain-containing protein [Candidatus Edwardsbacteria bacterium]MBU2593423.1 BatA and WFA domain-containing protein [Candidatus Edwardsbacteria bacterium]
MNFISFQNPAALFFLPLAALPLVIHLLRHNKARVVPFPSIILLRSTHTKTWKRSRLQEWLLLLVRTLILLLLVLLMAGPSVKASLPSWMAPRETTLALVIDNSASMSTIEGDSSLLPQARSSALKLIKSLSPDSRVAVLCGSQGNKILCGLADPAEAARQIRSIEQTDLGTDLAGAVLKADALLANAGRTGASIMIFSDLRKNCFGDAVSPLPALKSTAHLNLVQAGKGGAGKNLEWRNVKFYSLKKRLIIQGKTAPGLEQSLSLVKDGRVAFQSKIKPDSGGYFSGGMGWDGQGQTFMECSRDDMPLDDRYYFPQNTAGNTMVLLISEAGGILQQAFKALSGAGYQLKIESHPTPEAIAASDLIIVAGGAIAGIKSDLLEAVKNGAGLLIIPPERAVVNDYNSLLSNISPDLRITGMSEDSLPGALDLGTKEYFQDISSRDLRHISIYKYWRVPARPSALLTIGRKFPGLVMIDHGSGKAGIWLFGTEPGMTDIGFHPAFLALLNQACEGLLKSADPGYLTGQFLSGADISDLTAPDGKKISGLPDSRGKIKWPLEKAGFYSTLKNKSGQTLAVNIPPEESDLALLEDDELAGIMGKNKWSRQISSEKRPASQRGLNNIFLFLTGLFLMLELVLRSKLKIFLKKPLTT